MRFSSVRLLRSSRKLDQPPSSQELPRASNSNIISTSWCGVSLSATNVVEGVAELPSSWSRSAVTLQDAPCPRGSCSWGQGTSTAGPSQQLAPPLKHLSPSSPGRWYTRLASGHGVPRHGKRLCFGVHHRKVVNVERNVRPLSPLLRLEIDNRRCVHDMPDL